MKLIEIHLARAHYYAACSRAVIIYQKHVGIFFKLI